IPDGIRPAFMIDDGRGEDMEKKMDADEGGTGVDTADIHNAEGDARAALINFVGRDIATHHINNWMGDAGRIESIGWSIMPPETHADFGCPVPVSPYYVYYLKQCEELKDIHITTHGLTRDTAEVHSIVNDKYIRNGKYIIKLIWWINDINGSVWIEGAAEVSLPSRNS
ncbi:MAG: hypothetical protein HUJ76_09055, partial [Parasporobacterium sp.]|nr:hypothetical protein [Parasporobacterium sp.]